MRSPAAGAPAPALHVRRTRFYLLPMPATRPRGGGARKLSTPRVSLAAEGPSCLFVGPIETASKEMLEALYHQARDSYYSGKPLIVDDMFDKVELKLRLYGSESVKKYPRCSLRQQSTYADAEEDPSQVFALASIWILILAFGTSVLLLPSFYMINLPLSDSINSRYISTGGSPPGWLTTVNSILLVGLGYLVGYPIASASVKTLQDLWRNKLVALKGSCPNCGEEVFAFVRSDKKYQSPHSAECHVCESSLVFRTKVEQSISKSGRRWVYGRVYLISKAY